MKIAIYGKVVSDDYIPFIQSLFQCLEANDIKIAIFQPFYNLLTKQTTINNQITLFNDGNDLKEVDYLFSIGGDGTLLETITLIQNNNIPILGINTGRLGFLSSVSTDEIDQAISSIINNDFVLDNRMLLNLETENNPYGNLNFALNEITLQKKDTSSMVTIHVYLDGLFLNSYWADGLIISTPTGSTAYSLSCNGPIVLPGSGNIIITPIAPHNLNVRPLVIPDTTEISLKIEGRTDNFLIALDSRSITAPLSTKLKIKKSTHQIRLIRLKDHNFLNTLRNKLMWGVDKRN